MWGEGVSRALADCMDLAPKVEGGPGCKAVWNASNAVTAASSIRRGYALTALLGPHFAWRQGALSTYWTSSFGSFSAQKPRRKGFRHGS